MKNYSFTASERFLRYVKIDTQSDASSPSQPSTEKQKDLSRILVTELLAMGITDAHLDEFGYVYATIPANTKKKVPVLCFCSHVDTAPDCSGTNVKPLVHRNYQGQDIVLPDDTSQILKTSNHPELGKKIGHDIITASGLTLLGSDDKAGVAEIMDAAHYFMTHPEVKHGAIRILFTPDEEIGRGVDKVDIKKLNAEVGYTLDGGSVGDFENETFSADAVVITIDGVSTHPGYAKGKMENAIKIASDIVAGLPRRKLAPEVTDKKRGFIHPVKIEGSLEQAKVSFIIRDFDDELLAFNASVLRAVMDNVMLKYPHSKARFEQHEQYRNMRKVVEARPEISQYALEAIKRSGVKPHQSSIRGGTDGSRLSFMGLPCPNLFAAEQAIHSRHEWISIQDMNKAVETIVHLSCIWEERS
jgi:tripeptide aminopeptidase